MSTSTTDLNCPSILPVPFTITVNTSGTTPNSVDGHPAATTHAGFTRISKFTLTPVISAAGGQGIEDLFPKGVSNRIVKWDFGDGYTLSGADAFTATHIYNIPGIHTVSMFLYDKDSNAYKSTFTETISIYNYANTSIAVETRNITEQDGINARKVTAGELKTFNMETTASWQDIPDPDEPQTFFFTSSGSMAKPYDFNNKYGHIVPYNAFYDTYNNPINNVYGLKSILYPHYFYINADSVLVECAKRDSIKTDAKILYSSTDEYISSVTPIVRRPIIFKYFDDIPNTAVNLLIRIDTSRHRIQNFYVDDIETDINNSNRTFLETDIARPIIKDKSTINKHVGNSIGIPVKVITPFTSRLSFTSTGMREMSSIEYKRQGDKFQVFIALADKKLNIGKYYSPFFHEPLNNFITLLNSDFSSALSGSYADPSNWTIDAQEVTVENPAFTSVLSGSYADPSNWTIDAPTNTLTVTNSDFADATDWSAAISDQLGGVFNTVADPLPDPLSGWALSAENSGYAQHHPYTGGTVGGQIPAGQPAGPGHWSENYPHVNNLYQDVGAIGGKKYTVKLDVGYTHLIAQNGGPATGNLRVFLGGEATSTNGLLLPVTNDVTDAGTHKVTLESTGGNPQNVYFQASNDFNGAIDNVSIVESSGNLGVDSGWDWSTGGGTGKATHTPITLWTGHTGLDNLYQDIDAIVGRKYIVKLTVASCTAGNLRVFLGGQATSDNGLLLPVTTDVTDNGTHKVTLNATGSILYFQASDDFNGTIDNVSVIESHDGGLGDGESGWDWSAGIATHTAISTWTNDTGLDNLYQDINATLGNEYTVKLTINSCTTGHIRLFIGTTDPTPPFHRPGLSANEIHTVIVKSTNNEPQRLFIQASPDFNGQVDDISIDIRQFYYNWSDGNTTITSNISSLCTTDLPFNTTSDKTELSSFLYLNIDPLSAGTWTLNITGRLDSFESNPADAIGQTIDYDPAGPLGPVSIGIDNTVPPGVIVNNLITGSYTFTVFPSTNDVEIYKINEDTDYSKILKSYRFQTLQHEYDKLFDGIFTSFVGQASSSPTTFGKTIFEKIANFTMNNSDVDFCKIKTLESFYQFFNEDIDIQLPTAPSELRRLYDLFSIKISKLLGDYERYDTSFDTQFYTSSAASRNIDLNNPIDPATYTVTAGTKFVARQKFNNEFILINPQKVPTIRVDGSSSGVSTTYALNKYNVYSNWGWPLDTTISGSDGLSLVYEFYPYTNYNIISAENIQNNIIDYNNKYNTITRASSSLSANWDPVGGIVFKNLDYQIRKGLQL